MMRSNSLYPTLCALKPADNKPTGIAVVGAGGKTHAIYFLSKLLKGQGHAVCVTTTTKMFLPEANKVDHVVSTKQLSSLKDNKKKTTFVYKEIAETEGQPPKAIGLTEPETQHLFTSNEFDFVLVEADGAKGLALKAPARHEPCIPKQVELVIGVTSAELLLTPAQPIHIHRWQEFSTLTGCQQGTEINEAVIEKLINSANGLFKNSPTSAKKIWLINKMDLSVSKRALKQVANSLFKKLPELHAVWLTELNKEPAIYKILSR